MLFSTSPHQDLLGFSPFSTASHKSLSFSKSPIPIDPLATHGRLDLPLLSDQQRVELFSTKSDLTHGFPSSTSLFVFTGTKNQDPSNFLTFITYSQTPNPFFFPIMNNILPIVTYIIRPLFCFITATTSDWVVGLNFTKRENKHKILLYNDCDTLILV